MRSVPLSPQLERHKLGASYAGTLVSPSVVKTCHQLPSGRIRRETRMRSGGSAFTAATASAGSFHFESRKSGKAAAGYGFICVTVLWERRPHLYSYNATEAIVRILQIERTRQVATASVKRNHHSYRLLLQIKAFEVELRFQLLLM